MQYAAQPAEEGYEPGTFVSRSSDWYWSATHKGHNQVKREGFMLSIKRLILVFGACHRHQQTTFNKNLQTHELHT